ncbi:MAG: hypothetical protein L0Y58_02960 [Verrucomicrobia subdivision 3 bacterium]|nr:hypothetical protein [Limisphaerales bacterium]
MRQQLEAKALDAAQVDGERVATDQHLEELDRLGAELAQSEKLLRSLTNVFAENADLRRKVEDFERAEAKQEPNEQSAEVAAASQIPGYALPATGSVRTNWSQEQIEAYRCANNLLQINLAATLWAQAHNGFAPSNFVDLHEYIAPMTLICPSRRPRWLAVNWRTFDPSAITYQMTSPGVQWQSVHHSYARCPTHETVTFNHPGQIGLPSKYSINW